ncbi:hypothetical protein AMECASPLE_014037 [Ameca splendens]|uniref:Uncharacterized protein n=1 Tax=Ameca splendens TaxID=208324 RepID=A0ABV1A8N3_9TELE
MPHISDEENTVTENHIHLFAVTPKTCGKVPILCNPLRKKKSMVTSHRDKPPCATEDFLLCFEYRSFNHIFHRAALIADKYQGKRHHIAPVCFGTSTISPCKDLRLEFGRHTEAFCVLHVECDEKIFAP